MATLSSITGQMVVQPHFVDWTAYTPVFTAPFGTVSIHSFLYSEKLTSLDMIATMTTGTVDNGACRFTLPNSYTATRTQVVGQWWCYSNTGSTKKRGTLYSTAGLNDIRFGIDDYTGTKAPFSDEPTRLDLGFVSGQQINIKIDNMPITQLVALGPMRAYGAGLAGPITPGLIAGSGAQSLAPVLSLPNQYSFSARKTGTTAGIASGVLTVVDFTIEEYDRGGKYNNVTSNFQPDISGVYSIKSKVRMSATVALTSVTIRIYVNNVNTKEVSCPASSTSFDIQIAADFLLNANDAIEIRVAATTSSGTWGFDAGSLNTWFSGHKLS